MLLEWAFKREIDILFVGEMWVEKRKGNRTQTHRAFTLGSGVKKGKRVAVYWRKRLDGEVEVMRDEKNVVVVKIWGKKLGGVYVDGKSRMADWERWLESFEGYDSIVGDWNAHNPGWDPLCEQADGRGKRLEEWMIDRGWELGQGENGPTWERTREGRAEESRIDFFISKGPMEWVGGKRHKLLSDHWAITAEIEWHRVGEGVREERSRIDWDKLGVEVAEAEEEHEKGDDGVTGVLSTRIYQSQLSRNISSTGIDIQVDITGVRRAG